MWKKIYLTAFANFALIAMVTAQSSSVLEVNNIHFTVNSNGILGLDIANSSPGCEVPAGSGIHAMFGSGLWVGGVDGNNQLHLAAQQYESASNGDYWSGPLANNGTASIDPNVSAQFDQVWTVYRSDVDLHIAYFDCVHNPNCDENINFPNYQIPQYFLDWPAHGDANHDQDFYLAPYYDKIHNGLYDPNDGDYPCMPGDVAKYFIFNDAKTHAYSGGEQIGLEIHAIVYGYDSVDPDIANTVFVHYRIINQGTVTMNNTYAGVFTDFDLGNPMDDYLGSDLERNMMYVLNGDNNDEDGFSQGYGTQPPAFGVTLLNGPFLDADQTDQAPNDLIGATGYDFNDGVIDNERLGPTVMTYMGNDASPTGSPNLAALRWNRMAGFWNDGTHLVYGGNGHYLDPNADPNTSTTIVYPGISDPGGLATYGVPQAPWDESIAGHIPNDRRALMSMGPFTLSPGEFNEVELAYCYARANSGGPSASVTELQTRVDAVQQFYENEIHDYCGWTLYPDAVGIEDQAVVKDLLLFPSPTDGLVQFDLPQEMLGAQLEVLDLIGRSVISENVKVLNTRIDLSEMSSGLYLVRVVSEKMIYQGKVIKE